MLRIWDNVLAAKLACLGWALHSSPLSSRVALRMFYIQGEKCSSLNNFCSFGSSRCCSVGRIRVSAQKYGMFSSRLFSRALNQHSRWHGELYRTGIYFCELCMSWVWCFLCTLPALFSCLKFTLDSCSFFKSCCQDMAEYGISFVAHLQRN